MPSPRARKHHEFVAFAAAGDRGPSGREIIALAADAGGGKDYANRA